jgi:putative permease
MRPDLPGPRPANRPAALMRSTTVTAGIGLIGVLALLSVGDLLAPMVAAVLVAFLIDSAARTLAGLSLPEAVTRPVLYALFLCLLVGTLLYGIPLLWGQVIDLLGAAPMLIQRLGDMALAAAARNPALFEDADVPALVATLRTDLLRQAQALLSLLPASAGMLLNTGIYLFLVPFVTWFLVFDRDRILEWLHRFRPSDPVVLRVWPVLLRRLGGYVRGKTYEVLIVGVVAALSFYGIGLNWAVLLGTITGLSALIPIVGAVAAALPVLLVAYAQWGADPMVLWALGLYTVIQILDGNLLQPLLLAGTVGMHPVALVAAVLLCGGTWGIWGLLVAVPAAITVQAMIEILTPRSDANTDPGDEHAAS